MITASVETYDPKGHRTCEHIDMNNVNLAELLGSLRSQWSTTLRLASTTQELFISFSNGQAAALLAIGDGDFYDLVGDPMASGRVEFAHGGQLAAHPSRHIVTFEDVMAIASEFVRSGGLSISTLRWEMQGDMER